MNNVSTFKPWRTAIAAAVMAFAASAHAEFVTNGTFESVAAGNYTGSSNLINQTGMFTGWVSGNDTVTVFGSGGHAGRYLALGEGEAVAAQLQSGFTGFTENFTYNLDFWFRGNNFGGGSSIGSWRIVDNTTNSATFNPFSASTVTGTTTTGVGNNADSTAGSGLSGSLTETGNDGATWAHAVLNITYTNGTPGIQNLVSPWLVFVTSSGDGIRNLSLDDVSAVPEPETYAMFLAGLGALGFMARRRKMQ